MTNEQILSTEVDNAMWIKGLKKPHTLGVMLILFDVLVKPFRAVIFIYLEGDTSDQICIHAHECHPYIFGARQKKKAMLRQTTTHNRPKYS